MKSNFHTHTRRCLHAYGSERDYVLKAAEEDLSILGFSDHGPFPDHDFGYRMPYEELEHYLQSIDKLSEEFKGNLQLYKGLEIEYHQRYDDYYRFLLQERHLDYLALGEHFYYDPAGNLQNIVFASSTEAYLEYADNVCRGMETGLFRFVAHPDLYCINVFPWDDRAQEACQRIVSCAAKHDMILEFNANGFRRGKRPYPDGLRVPYPHPAFWEKVREQHLRVIIGSDCHAPEQVADESVRYAAEQAKRLGLDVVDTIF